jgi:integrin beta 3
MPLDSEALADLVFAAIKTATDPLVARIRALEARQPRDGRDGVDGKDGAPGRDGVDGLNGKDGLDGIDGKDGARGLDGKDGIGIQGERGLDGRDGRDGKDGIDGKDGAPGLNGTLDGLEMRQSEDFRTVEFFYKATGEPVPSGRFYFPVVIDKGVYTSGVTYQRGDNVTYAGSSWIAQRETDEVPGEGSTAWRLSAKRGREGKAGKDGKPGKDGKDGAPGRDGTKSW